MTEHYPNQRCDQHADDIRELKEQVGQIDTAIRGNGTPGLKQRMSDLERDQNTIKRIAIVIATAAIVAGVDSIFNFIGRISELIS